MKIRIILLFFYLTVFTSFAKDVIVQKGGSLIICDVVLEDSTTVYFIAKINEEKKTTFLQKDQISSIIYDSITHNYDIILLKNNELYCGDIYAVEDTLIKYRDASDGGLNNSSFAKNRVEKVISNLHKEPYKFGLDRFSASIGLGFVNGGLGFNFCGYPFKFLGIFLGGGMAGPVPSGCVGIKLRTISENYTNNFVPYCIGMYGLNTIIFDDHLSDWRAWYGFTVGLGLEIRPDLRKTNYFSIACLYPFRDPEAGIKHDVIIVGNSFNVSTIKPKLSPITINVAYHF